MSTSIDHLLSSVPPSSPSKSIPQLPRPPSPSADAGITPRRPSRDDRSATIPRSADIDITTLKPVSALKMLSSTVETLVEITGDVPPTPPTSRPTTPDLSTLKLEKATVARSRESSRRRRSVDSRADAEDMPARCKTPIGSPEGRGTEALHVIGAHMEPLLVQHGAIARKFYSKKPPAISLEEYLLRLHQFCPMSTGVYLATSLYIYRLAVVEQIIPVTARNAHRLVLAGLRIAMKALEDQSYPHRRFARVGGVSEAELGRLEISFCFVTDFDLRVTSEELSAHAKTVRDEVMLYKAPPGLIPRFYISKDNAKVILPPSRPLTPVHMEASAAAG